MELVSGKTYVLVIELQSKILTYTATIVEDSENFISFVDKFGDKYDYNKRVIVSATEVKDGD